MSMPETTSFLRRILFADAGISGAAGLLLSAGAAPLQELLALPEPLLRFAGMSLLPFAAAVLLLSRQPIPRRAAVISVIAINAAWVAASVALLAVGAARPNGLGIAFVLAQAAAVAVLAEMQYVGLRRSAQGAA